MVKLGVIGMGHMGGYHASICLTSHRAQLVGIADPNDQLLEKIKSPDVIKSNDYTTWIDSVDGVIIAVPTQLHYSIARDCLSRGKHVLIEKPLTNDLAQASELFELARQHSLTLHVGHVERFNGAVQELKKIIAKPYLIESCRMGPFSPRVQKDSVILDLMIHDLDIVLGLVSSPVSSFGVQGTKVHTQSCDIASVNITFENGVVANLISSRASHIKKRMMAIHQKDAYIELDFTTQNIAIHRQGSASIQVSEHEMKYKRETMVEHLFVYKDNPLKLEIEHFITTIATKQNMANPDQDLGALALTFDIERALGLR